MIKKLLFLLVMLVPASVMAQYGSGSWKIHPNFVAARLQNNIDTGNKVYYLVSNCLYCYDKATQTNEAFNNGNKLSDVTITNIYYNHYKNYVVLTYDNSNIDFILDDGRVINMPEIKDAVVQQSKVINDINFMPGKAFVATDFGYLIIDDNTFNVTESRLFGVKVLSALQVGSKFIISYGAGIYYCDDNSPRESINNFRSSSVWKHDMKFYPIDESHFFINHRDSLELCTLNDAGTMTLKTIAKQRPVSIQRTPSGFIANFPASNFYITTDATGNNPVTHPCNGEILSVNPHGDGTPWALSAKGVYDVNNPSSASMPNGIGIQTVAFWAQYNPGDQKIYLASTTTNALLPNANSGAKTEIWNYDGKLWKNVTPPNVPLYKNGADTYQGNYWLNFVDGTKDSYVFTTRSAGACHVIDGVVKKTYYFLSASDRTMPLNDKYKPCSAIDSHGNLWLAQSYKTSGKPVAVLPKEKFDDPDNVTLADWYTPNVPNMDVNSFNRSMFTISKGGSDIKVYCSGDFQKQIVFWDNKGDISNLNPDTRSYTQFKDEDDKTFQWNNVICLFAASDGKVWIGTNSGIGFLNPTEAFNKDFRISQVKITREDGTGWDYLIDGVQVNCITEDNMHRKWIGTHTNGFYIISPDGTKELHHFTTDNSIMQSNTIYNIAFNPATSSAIIVTSNGVCEYFCDTTPAANDFSNVTVYPNPVLPHFTGYVTISELMNASHVKIADAQGKIYKELVSTGGVCSWDCCDASGERVPTGTYTVMASTSATGSFTPVAQFLVIK